MIKSDKHIDFHLIGLGNHTIPELSQTITQLIATHSVFSGGKRHYQLIKDHLPSSHQWIEISGDMPLLIQKYHGINVPVVVFASGDPFFYGFGNTLKRLMPDAKLNCLPHFNCIQLLCHKTQTNYNELENVSVHGRDWSALDTVLIRETPLIGILTDSKKNPATIAARLMQFGFNNYSMTIGENLEGESEVVKKYSLEEASKKVFSALSCILLHKDFPQNIPFGIPDNALIPLPNRPKMVTKMAIRLNTLQALNLQDARVFWDIGSCTGSVAIEAKRHYPSLKITAFEIRKECKTIIRENMENLSTPGIDIEIGDFFNQDLDKFRKPDVVFIGGHGNRLAEMINKVHRLNPHARLVINAVQENTRDVFLTESKKLNFSITSTNIRVDDHNEIGIYAAESTNEAVKQ